MFSKGINKAKKRITKIEIDKEKAAIYAESWEASKDRVTASLEGIYDSLINDEFFIDLNNTLAKSIGAIEKLVDSLGGMSGVLGMIGVLATRIF